MLLQPVPEQRRQLRRQAQHDREAAHRAGFVRGLQHAFELGFVDEGNQRRDADAHRHAGLRERADRAQPAFRRGRARLQTARQRRVQRRQRDVDTGQPGGGHRCDEVQVALDQRRLGDQRERVPRLVQQLQHRTRQAQPAFDRLVGVGDGADGDRPRPVAAGAQRGAQALGGVDLGHQPGLEVQAGRPAEIGVRWPCVAVDAAVLAAAVRVQRDLEADVRRVVLAQDAAGVFLDDLGRQRLRRLAGLGVQRPPAIVESLAHVALEAVGDRPGRAASLQRGVRRRVRRRGGWAERSGRRHAVVLYSMSQHSRLSSPTSRRGRGSRTWSAASGRPGARCRPGRYAACR